MEKPRAVFEIVFHCFSSGSRSKQHQENHADNTKETVTHFNHCHQQFPNFSKNINTRFPGTWPFVVMKLHRNCWKIHGRRFTFMSFSNSSCRNKPTCTCSGNSLRYGLLLDVAFRKLFAIKQSYSLPYRTGNMAKGTKWWPSMATLQIGMCPKLPT